MEEKYYIAVFKSKNYAMQVNYVLEKLGHKEFQLISTPCEIKAGCNYSIKFLNLDDFEKIKEVSIKLDVAIDDLYRIQRKDGRKVIKNLNYLI